MKLKEKTATYIISAVLGWFLGMLVASVIHTYLGLTILTALGWMPV